MDLTPEERKKIYEEEKAKNEKKPPAAIGIGCLAIFILFIIGFIWSCSNTSPTTKAPEHDKVSAYIMSQEFVNQRLKAPASAKYPNSRDAQIEDLGDGKYRISSYVDAQNSFGAMMRTKYKATVKYVGANKWVLEDFQM